MIFTLYPATPPRGSSAENPGLVLLIISSCPCDDHPQLNREGQLTFFLLYSWSVKRKEWAWVPPPPPPPLLGSKLWGDVREGSATQTEWAGRPSGWSGLAGEHSTASRLALSTAPTPAIKPTGSNDLLSPRAVDLSPFSQALAPSWLRAVCNSALGLCSHPSHIPSVSFALFPVHPVVSWKNLTFWITICKIENKSI